MAVFFDIFLILSGSAIAHINSKIMIIITVGPENTSFIRVSLILVMNAVINVTNSPRPNQLYTLVNILLLILSPSF